jgi:hypothetical protein
LPGASGGSDPRRLNGAKLTRFSHRAVSAIGLQAFTACDFGLALGLGVPIRLFVGEAV